MGRGIRLACEQCDFAALLLERAPFAYDAAGEPLVLPTDSTTTPDGYWSDSLCGECRLPVRLIAGEDAERLAHCPTCSSVLLPFAEAARELAEASHSRVWRDLALERTGGARVRSGLEAATRLEEELHRGDRTTQAALDALAAEVLPGAETPQAEELAGTSALGGLAPLIENAADLAAAARLLAEREAASARQIGILEKWCADEALLPGVPCPQCGTGQLIHWPAWE
ncbi:MAG TPA: hypothetical protein VKC57_00455 [Ktedonobacterales bacterium]|nr:hypothetical protein [Ktedonobacterales bacterium]